MMVNFKCDALYRNLHKEPPEVGLVKKLTGRMNWWVEQCMSTLHRESVALSDDRKTIY